MADAILMSGGVGGVTSDDVTARREQVLQGYTALTSDSDDEPVQGTMANRGNIVDTVELVNAHWDSKFLARMEQGYYSQNGQYKPCVAIPYAVLANVAGVDASKMLDTLTVAGTRGTIPNRGVWNEASEVVNAPWESTVHTRFERGYYPQEGQFKPTAKIPYSMLANAIGLDNSKILDNYNILGKQGTIPRWICTTGDVITALGGEGFAWDDTHANRGRGIVVRIPNGYYIQGANWAFLPSPNHLPHNIRKGVNINGTIGTMEDYGCLLYTSPSPRDS